MTNETIDWIKGEAVDVNHKRLQKTNNIDERIEVYQQLADEMKLWNWFKM